jgi:lysophospholipase L1-like esterase
LFRVDGLHLNEKGYEILNEAVRPYLRAQKS